MAQISIQQAFDLAVQHQQASRLREAEYLFRQIIAQRPDDAAAIHSLGVVLGQAGRSDEAVEWIRRAIALRPNWPEAYNNLGLALTGNGKLDEAVAAYRHSLTLRPSNPSAHYNLANSLNACGKLDEAIAAYRKSIFFDPKFSSAYNNLGAILRVKLQLEEAVAACRQAIALQPNHVEAYINLGNALKDQGESSKAIAAFRKAIALRPDCAQAYSNLANIFQERGQLDEAIDACRHAIVSDPALSEAHNNLGNILSSLGQLDQAIAAYQQAIAINPNVADTHNNLGVVLKDKGQVDAAIASHRRAIALKPKNAMAHSNLGNVLKDTGQLDEAIAAYRRAISLAPQDSNLHSNLIFALHYHPDFDAHAIAEELRIWNRQHADAVRRSIEHFSKGKGLSYPNDRNPDRPLRIGYVSPDLRGHVVGQNLLPLLRNHDRANFKISCYAQVAHPDPITDLIRQQVDSWRNISGISDAQLAKQIREDQIDILVDLTLHSGQNRLLVFARKPAPVQVTYLAYCGSSGINEMDYRFSDPYLDPADADLFCYTEKTLCLPRTYWCYQSRTTPLPAPPPALKNGFVTFGCLNNFAKVSRTALSVWGEILLSVPDSRMIIQSPAGAHLDEVANRLERAGVAKNRVRFGGKQLWTQYVETYAQIDIALDPFPFGGGITTLDTLWMGVPVITLSGSTAVGRGGRSILSNLGLHEFIAFDVDQYKKIAIELTLDMNRMTELRSNMRARMLASPLLDGQAFARDVEAAYRTMWRNRCAALPVCNQ